MMQCQSHDISLTTKKSFKQKDNLIHDGLDENSVREKMNNHDQLIAEIKKVVQKGGENVL